MKKKIIILSICIVIAFGAIGAFANGAGNAITTIFGSNTTQDLADELETNEDVQSTENQDTFVSEDVFSEENIEDSSEKTSRYNEMILVMDQTISDPEIFNDVLIKYEYIKEVHELSQSELDYISDLIISGCDAETVLRIAYFWLDTNDDISILKAMYDLKDEYEGKRNWLENAYDRVTNASNGSLNLEDVQYYYSQGLTTEDIRIADRLCRMGVYTIQEILEARLSGISFVTILDAIENGVSFQKPQVLGVSDVLEDVYNAIEFPDAVLNAQELSCLSGETKKEIINKAISGVDVNEELNEARNDKFIQIMMELSEKSMLKTETEVE